MDTRFSQRWSSIPSNLESVSAPRAASSPNVNHVSFSQPAAKSTPPLSKPLPRRPANQRWSTTPTSSLAMNVQTIDYDNDEPETSVPAARNTLKRTKSILNVRLIMRQLFSTKKDKEEVPPLPTKSTIAEPTITKPAVVKQAIAKPAMTKSKSIKSRKSEPVLAADIPEKEQHLWNRLSIVVRPPKSFDPPKPLPTPKRNDSGVDVQSLKSALKPSKHVDYPNPSLSTASLPSFPIRQRTPSVTTSVTITGTPILLTLAERNHLVAELQHAQQLVRAHSLEAEGFSKNLAGLLWDKEHYIIANKRLSEDTKNQMCEEMQKVRDATAKTFARKGAFYERTLDVIERLLNDLGVRSLKSMAERNGSTSSLRSISPDSTLSTALTLTNSPSHTSSESERDGSEKREYSLTLKQLRTGLQTLKADLTGHSHLDPALRNGVVKPANERKFPTSENEMVAMKRFVRFVDGRVKKLGEGYWEMGRWVRSLESWVDDLEESGC